MNNTRFATAVHILSVMAVCPNEWLTSEVIAGSANVNPVVVRKEILVLKEAGLGESMSFYHFDSRGRQADLNPTLCPRWLRLKRSSLVCK